MISALPSIQGKRQAKIQGLQPRLYAPFICVTILWRLNVVLTFLLLIYDISEAPNG